MNVREKQRKLRWSAALVSVALLAHGASIHAANTATIGQPGRDPGGVECSKDEYLAGFAVVYADSMGSLQPYCVGMQADGAWKTGAQVHVDRSMGEASDGRRLDLFCGKDSYAFGVTGFSHVYGINSLMQLTLICRNPRTGAQSTFGTTKPSGPSLTEWPTVLCEANSVATGVFGTTTNGRLTQFGLSCARTPQALVQAADTSDRPNLEAAPPRTLVEPAAATLHSQLEAASQPAVSSAGANATTAPASATSKVNPAQNVLLNPQPLPPKVRHAARKTASPAPGEDRGIIIVGGKQVQPGDEVQLNPQPLPPKGATQASAVSSASANATTTSTATATRTRAPLAGSEVLQPDSATATAATTQPSATSKVYPAQDVLLNPQPLPPQGAVLQKRQQPVLVSSPSTPLSSGSTRADTKLQQSPLAGSATGTATAADNLQAHEIICRGGETLAIARVSEAPPPESTLTSIMYFNPSAQPGGTDGRGFEPGQCGYIAESWANPHAEIIEFTTRPGDGPGSLVELATHLNNDGFWSFRVREDERGFFVADQHAKWIPGRGPGQEAVRIKKGMTGVEMRVRGPARAKVTATLHAPMPDSEGGTLYGPPLGGISLTGQRIQESGEYLLSTEKSGPKLEPGELYYYVVTVDPSGAEDAQFHRGGFRTLTTYATAGTAIAGSATSPIAAAGSAVNPLPVAERVKPQPTDGIQGEGAGARSDAKVDCVNNPPRIAHVRGAITPGGQFTIAGMCFGTAPGQVEINGQFAGGTLKPDSQWGDSNVVVQIPATPPIAALASHKVAISVIRAPDGRKSAALAADFRGEPLRVRVPDHLWTPSARFQKTDVAERSTSFGALPFSSTGFAEKTFSQAFRVAINPGCRLDTVDVPATTGRIVSIEGWQGPDPHQDEVTVTWTRRCETTEHYYVITGEKTTECSAAFSLEAWAICPRGVSVNP